MKKISYLTLLVLLVACAPKRNFFYFNKSQAAVNKDSLFKDLVLIPPQSHIVSSGDIVTINLVTENPMDNNVFQTQTSQGAVPSEYEVSADGVLNIPLTGKIKSAGLNINQLEDTVKKRLEKYFINPFVRVSLVSFKIVVLGEVHIPGLKRVVGDQINILEALSLANDLTNDGNRTGVKVVRYVDGKASIYNLDLSSSTVFKSPVFYLQSNDVVYVPIFNTTRLTSKGQQIISIISIMNFIVTVSALMINLSRK